jgi:hypothetical protein
MSRIQEDEVDYLKIPLECPKCRLHGWTLVTRADRRFRCKRCKTQFYIDRRGNIAPGTPPPTFDTVPRPPIDPLAIINAWWGRRARLTKLAMVLGVAASVIAAVAWQLRPGPTLPQTLAGRADYAARAIARNDVERLRAVVSPESASRINAWIEKNRPSAWGKSLPADKEVDVEVKVLGQNFTQGNAWVKARVAIVSAADRAADGEGDAPADGSAGSAATGGQRTATGNEKELLMFWKMGTNKLWQLDCSSASDPRRR